LDFGHSPPEVALGGNDRPSALPQPRLVPLPDVTHRFLGTRPNGLEGAIVHFDAGRTRPPRGADDPDWGGRACLRYAEQAGYAYLTVSRAGTIFLPGNMDWQKWGSHAGRSRCPVTGRTGVSRHYVGFEVNSPGFVYPTQDSDLFVPWFDAVRDSKGAVLLDAKGRARIRSPQGEIYRRSEIRVVSANIGNIRPGVYVPYTAAQMEALFAAMLWLRRRFSSTFRLDRVFGHDEVAPTRKVDPGGALGAAGGPAMTMAAFRTSLATEWRKRG
jgi:hypothetical protein